MGRLDRVRVVRGRESWGSALVLQNCPATGCWSGASCSDSLHPTRPRS